MGQAVVFGLPVWGLQWFGRSLGGPEADRWVGILQALLAGWVAYVGAAGMLFEGIVRLARGRLGPDLVVAALAVVLYAVSLIRVVILLLDGPPSSPLTVRIPALFHWVVMLLAAWTLIQWQRMKTPGRDVRPGA